MEKPYIIDSHAHLTSDELFPELEVLVARARLAKVAKIVNICTDVKTLERGIVAAKLFPEIVNVGSTTPHDVETEGAKFFPDFERAAKNGQLVGIGETGLDYFYEHSNRVLQKEYLIRYFNLAKECKLPVVIHCREAFADLFKIADEHYNNSELVLHCFTGTLDEANEVIRRGWRISFSGIVTFKKSNELREVVKQMPLDRIFIETDAPYLAPQSNRGKRNEPAFVTETGELIAQLKDISPEELFIQTAKNIKQLFALG